PKLEGGGLETLQESGQPPRDAVINSQLINHARLWHRVDQRGDVNAAARKRNVSFLRSERLEGLILSSEHSERVEGFCEVRTSCARQHEGHGRGDQTRRLWSTAAPTNEAKRGCGSNGRDLSSGWNCTPMNQGWS